MIREETIAVLRAIKEHGPLTTRDVERKLARPQYGCKSSIHALLNEHEFIDVFGFEGNRQRYCINANGERQLRMMDAGASGQGQMPAPRTAPPSGRYEPKPWNPPRAESLAFLSLPSLHCGQQIERKRPAIIAGKAMQAVGMHGGVL